MWTTSFVASDAPWASDRSGIPADQRRPAAAVSSRARKILEHRGRARMDGGAAGRVPRRLPVAAAGACRFQQLCPTDMDLGQLCQGVRRVVLSAVILVYDR